MATLYITEFESMTPTSEGGAAQVARTPAVAEQSMAITGSSTLSAAFNAKTKFVRLHTDATCSIEIDGTATPTATAAKMRLATNQTEYFGVTPGTKLAVITNS